MKYIGPLVVRSVTLGTLAITTLLIGTSLPAAAQTPLYKACADYKLSEPLAVSTPNATQAATTAPTQPSKVNTTASDADDIVFMTIVGADSEACYVASETFLDNNIMSLPSGFNGAVGVTKTIQGDIALDRTNTANSQIGDITINISEFKSDEDQRDGYIRTHYLESNKYPYATLSNAMPIGLPTGAYQDGTVLTFQIKGTLTVHGTKRDTLFDATGSYSGGTLVVTAITQLKMSEFGITVPDIGDLLKVDDALKLVINIVARQSESNATPTK